MWVERKGPRCHPAGTTGFGLDTPNGVCFVGIAPGADEVIRGTPFTGPSGQLLNALLDACHWPRSQVYTTNLLCWWKNDPTLEEILECAPRLHSELADLKPKLIIPLGEIATDYLLGNFPIGLNSHTPSDWNTYAWSQINAGTSKYPVGEEYFGFASRRGRTTWSSALNAYVMPTYHPSAVLRGHGGSFISDIIRALSKIPLIVKEFKDDGREAAFDYEVINSVESGQRILDELPRGRPGTFPGVALDIETNYGRQDIDWWSEDLLCLSLTWGWNTTRVIPGHIAKQLDWSVTKRHSNCGQDHNCSEGVHWLGQNFIFDSGGMRRWISGPASGGIVDLPIHEDLMFGSYVLDERPGYHDLERLGGEWCAAPMWKSELAKYTVQRTVEEPDKNGKVVKRRRRFREVPDDALYRYNAGDTTYTYRSQARQQRFVVQDGMERVYRDILIPAANAFKDIQYRGLYIDQRRQSELMVDWCELWLEQEDQLNQMVHKADPEMAPDARLKFRSHPQMVRFIYDVLKAPPQYKKPNTRGVVTEPKLTTDKDALEILKGTHPFFNLFHEWRMTDHQMQVSEGVRNRIKIDGMLHAVPKIHGTETGRLSYENPNVQNWAQSWIVGDNLARIREIIAPVNSDTHVIMEADYKQVELWMALWWSQDEEMRRGLETGDFHRVTAMDVFNKTWDEVTKGDRFWTKIITFGRLYERGAADMKRGRGFEDQSIAELEEWIRRWNAKYHQYIEWSTKLKQQAMDDGIITTPWGRKRRYYLVMGDDAHHQLRSALNFCMQSTAHDYTLTSLIEIQKWINEYDSYILTENHDAILFEISRKYFREVVERIVNTMETVRPNSDWPILRVDLKSGPNWGLAKEECKACHKVYPETDLPNEDGYCSCILQKVA